MEIYGASIMPNALFDPITIADLEMPNRVVVAPMCQYTAEDGTMNDWHLVNLGQFAMGGPGLIIIEATAVEAVGRITAGCTGIYSDENETAMLRVVDFCRSVGHSKVALQLGHAGRKASADRPWDGGKALNGPDSWITCSSSALPFDGDWHTPQELDLEGLNRIKIAFVEASKRAERMRIDAIELHAAHGYLLHQFLSPISNHRTDSYGGSFENRVRYPLEVVAAVREIWPEGKPLMVRLSATDWIPGGWDLSEATEFSKLLGKAGCDAIHVSTGGLSPKQKIAVGPGFQCEHASFIRKETKIPVIAVGMITEPTHADSLVRTGQADMVALAREFLRDPRWTWRAAKALGASSSVPPQYQRAQGFN